MEAYYRWLNKLVNKNRQDYYDLPGIKWLNYYNSETYQRIRDGFLNVLDGSNLFKNTKPFHSGISRGCQICGEGKWSCLFITNQCNAGCFYCPVPQNQDEVPSTQGLDFSDPDDYAEFVKYFGFKGVSFSGGEPLLFPDRTLSYLGALKTRNRDIYTWMYTNGILANRKKLKQLADKGLDEIRFDIGANKYLLDSIALAKGLIPNLTIEIPAIPEEKERIISLLPLLKKSGVTNLNLHQLRLTRHNAKHLIKRGYTIIPAEQPIVLESELMALEILALARKSEIETGINYCSFHYKHRFQKAGYRKQLAILAEFRPDMLTENGYIRRLEERTLSYYTVRLKDKLTPGQALPGLNIGNKKYYYSLDKVFEMKDLNPELVKKVRELINSKSDDIPVQEELFEIWQYEFIEKGLRDY